MPSSYPAANFLKVKEFDLNHTLSCGQVFRWRFADGWWYGLIEDCVLRMRQRGDMLEYLSSKAIDEGRIRRYFSLEVDMDEILESIDIDAHMHKAIRAFRGLRIIRQRPAECLISYILSSNNNIPRITTLIERMSECFGEREERLNGVSFHTFPTLRRLSLSPSSRLKACGIGFRVPYVRETAREVLLKKRFFSRLRNLSYDYAKQNLLCLKGVGEKIADCVLLFSLDKYEAFPVDVWIKRAIGRFYFHSKDITLKDASAFGRDYFGRYAGWAQEYLYCYIRERG